MTTNRVQTWRVQDLRPETGAGIYALIQAVWPTAAGAKAPGLDQTLSSWRADDTTHFVIPGELPGQVLAHAMIFRREIATPSGLLTVGALAKVCVPTEFRGQNFGTRVVHAALDYISELGVAVSLFQTGVPHFYEKLGGLVVTNRFFNGTNAANPFWDSCAMIYPASFAWPEGPIDLKGCGY